MNTWRIWKMKIDANGSIQMNNDIIWHIERLNHCEYNKVWNKIRNGVYWEGALHSITNGVVLFTYGYEF